MYIFSRLWGPAVPGLFSRPYMPFLQKEYTTLYVNVYTDIHVDNCLDFFLKLSLILPSIYSVFGTDDNTDADVHTDKRPHVWGTGSGPILPPIRGLGTTDYTTIHVDVYTGIHEGKFLDFLQRLSFIIPGI